MDILDISNMNGGSTFAGKPSLGKEDFLNLLLKQLSYQDPLNPLDSTEFTAQLAQFSSLEELNNINDTLEEVLAFQHSMQNAAVTNLIGKTVQVPGNTTYLEDAAYIHYGLLEEAASVEISIFNGVGKLIRSENLGPHTAGNNSYLWDGKDSFGNKMPEGTYIFEIEALDSSGNQIETVTSSSGDVTGVVYKNGDTYLVLNGRSNVHLNDIQTIEERRN